MTAQTGGIVAEPDVDQLVAQRLARLRKESGWTLTVLSERSGISAPHLSRLEKGDRQPSIGALLQLARAYGKSLSELVQEDTRAEFHLLRAGDSALRRTPEANYSVLSGPRAAISVAKVTIEPGRVVRASQHEGEEWLYVNHGRCTVVLDGTEIELGEGDALHFDAWKSHTIINNASKTLDILLVSTTASTPAHHPLPPPTRAR